MRKLFTLGLAAATATCVIWAADWPGQSGSPQRDGWARAEKAFTKENAAKIEFLYKYKAENQARGLNSIGSPVVNGFLITHLGFKEMLGFAGSGDNAWSVDADLNRIIWKSHFEYKADRPQVTSSTSVCPGGLTSAMVMPGSASVVAGARGGAPPPGRGAAGRGPGAAAPGRGPVAPPAIAAPPAPQLMGAGNFGRGANFAVVSADGSLHVLNSSTGVERATPMVFAPANAKLAALNTINNIVYGASLDNCGGNPNALYVRDLNEATPRIFTFETEGGSAAGAAGTAIATDGTVYAQIPDGNGEVAGKYNDTVLAFTPELKVKDYFTPAGPLPATKKGVPTPGATPAVFTFKGRDLVVAGSRDGRLYLLDAKSLGGADHHTPLFRTEPVAAVETKFNGAGFQGTFSTYEEDNNGPRWIYASVWGPVAKNTNGAIVAFQVEDQNGSLSLTQKWTSRDMATSAPVVTANGLVFALSMGQSARAAKEDGTIYSVAEKKALATKAVLYVLDGATGKDLYNSGSMATTFSNAGLAIANRRIYFTTNDNFVYSLGFLAEQPQLTGK